MSFVLIKPLFYCSCGKSHTVYPKRAELYAVDWKPTWTRPATTASIAIRRYVKPTHRRQQLCLSFSPWRSCIRTLVHFCYITACQFYDSFEEIDDKFISLSLATLVSLSGGGHFLSRELFVIVMRLISKYQ